MSWIFHNLLKLFMVKKDDVFRMIFIRHGEKTKHDRVNLSDKGLLRADYMAEYFSHPMGEFDIPRALYAMSHVTSKRCEETLYPFGKIQGLRTHLVRRSDTHKFIRKLVSKNMYSNDTVLICWEHDRIVDMLVDIGAEHIIGWGLDPEMRHDKDCFDATWVVDIDGSGNCIMKVYKQFQIDNDGTLFWDHPRNHVYHKSTFRLKLV